MWLSFGCYREFYLESGEDFGEYESVVIMVRVMILVGFGDDEGLVLIYSCR